MTIVKYGRCGAWVFGVAGSLDWWSFGIGFEGVRQRFGPPWFLITLIVGPFSVTLDILRDGSGRIYEHYEQWRWRKS
jgi:hypothetical protein